MRYRGVAETADGRYEARTFSEGRESSIGTFDSDVEAARAYDIAMDAKLGEFAEPVLNFPDLLPDQATLD